ncbi:MAG: hypothetical protein ACYCV0_14105 [Desulfitobacteriaceae bacterium]
MSTTHADKLKSSWFRQKYYIDGGYIKPFTGQTPQRYNPLDFYKPSTPGHRSTDSLHHKFANLDLSKESEIEGFYTNYGPLGLFERDIINVVAFQPDLQNIYRMPDISPVAGVQRFSNELVPLDELINRYHIPEDKLPIPKPGDLVMPITEITALDTLERLEDFKAEVLRYRRTLDLRYSLADKDTGKLRDILVQDRHPSTRKNVLEMNETELLITASGLVLWEVNGAMENRVHPRLTFNSSGYEISKEITWDCDSLLTALYVMIFLDISRGALTRRCLKCNQYFEPEPSRPNTKYCSPSHQAAAKTQRLRNRD